MPDGECLRDWLAASEEGLGLALDDVVVVLASNERYVPYLSVVVQSLCEHARSARRYDIVVLTADISRESARALHGQVEALARAAAPARETAGEAGAGGPRFSIGFLDMRAALKGWRLRSRNRFGAEAHFRLLAPTLLPGVCKAVYLDADLVVLNDVAGLFDTDVSGRLLAAAHDPDTEGQVAGYDPMVRPYLEKIVGLRDLGAYFQSGVLVLNLEELRRRHSISEMVGLALSRSWRWPDQDILNLLCQGDYTRLDMRWNVLFDWQGLRRAHIVGQASKATREAYEAARRDPWIVHYAGPDNRPWLYPQADMAGLFWDSASRCPFFEELRRRLYASYANPARLGKRGFLYFIYKCGLPMVDAALPPGTLRRAAVIAAYERLGGQCT